MSEIYYICSTFLLRKLLVFYTYSNVCQVAEVQT